MSDPITRFRDEYAFLSNFYPAEVMFEGEAYPTVEHAYQAAKTLDPAERRMVREAPTPDEAKLTGGKVTLREGWDALRVEIMTGLVRSKFTTHPELAALKFNVISIVLNVHQSRQKLFPRDLLLQSQRDNHSLVILLAANAINARHAGDDDHIPTSEQRTHGG